MSPVVGGRCRDTCLNSSNVSDSGGNKQRKHSTVKVGPAGCSFPGIIVAEPVGKFTRVPADDMQMQTFTLDDKSFVLESRCGST